MNGDKMNMNNVEAEYMEIANRNAWPIIYQVSITYVLHMTR